MRLPGSQEARTQLGHPDDRNVTQCFSAQSDPRRSTPIRGVDTYSDGKNGATHRTSERCGLPWFQVDATEMDFVPRSHEHAFYDVLFSHRHPTGRDENVAFLGFFQFPQNSPFGIGNNTQIYSLDSQAPQQRKKHGTIRVGNTTNILIVLAG